MVKLYKIWSLILLIGAFVLSSGTAFAQSSEETTGFAPGGKGYKQVNFGIKLQENGIPVYLGMDFGVGKMITVGPRIIIHSQGESMKQMVPTANGREEHEISYRYTLAIPSFRGDYHFSGHINGLPPELDLYGGLTLGFVVVRSSTQMRIDGKLTDDQPEPHNNITPKLWGQLGARYFFTNSWGVQLEFATLNRANSGSVGLSYRF